MNSRNLKITGSIFCLILILFSYQHCGKITEKEIQGISALTAPPTNVAIEPATVDLCADGGVSLKTYIDTNINGKLDEKEAVVSTQNICNGAKGATGPSGSTGADGKGAGILVSPAVAGACSSGGINVITFVDTNNNGILDTSEMTTSTSSICNGVAGTDGKSSELTVTKATTAQCSNGGVVYTSTSAGADPDTNIICNGADGSSSVISSQVANISQCPTGGTVLEIKNDGSDPAYSVICNGVAGEKGSAGTSSYITTSVANPYQCKNGGVVISTWIDALNPKTDVLCNGEKGETGASPVIATENATSFQCPTGGVIVTTTNPGAKSVMNVVCNGAVGEAGTNGNGYITGVVGPLIPKTNLSACHHDFMYFPSTSGGSTGWLTFRHQKNGSEDQGIGTTGFNVWNVDISNFALASEAGNVTYCNLTYDPKAMTLNYTVVDKTDGFAGKTGTITLKQ
ncbi:MAG: hypothetical protein H7177_02650 [Rhizobacter sp.]|nr:hypothetical protein [Bacteriovorax sp.]